MANLDGYEFLSYLNLRYVLINKNRLAISLRIGVKDSTLSQGSIAISKVLFRIFTASILIYYRLINDNAIFSPELISPLITLSAFGEKVVASFITALFLARALGRNPHRYQQHDIPYLF